MTIEHSIITDPNIHEPKGVSTATAEQVYSANGIGSGTWINNYPRGIASAASGARVVADGAGSASWIRTEGYGDYQDTDTTVGTPTQNIATGVRTRWLCDGGTATVERLSSDSVDSLWDVSTSEMVPVSVNDVYMLRVSFIAENYAGATPYIDLELDIGGSIGVIHQHTTPLLKGGSAQSLSYTIPVYAGSTFVANNCIIYVTYTGTGTCDLYKNNIFITREQRGYI